MISSNAKANFIFNFILVVCVAVVLSYKKIYIATLNLILNINIKYLELETKFLVSYFLVFRFKIFKISYLLPIENVEEKTIIISLGLF